MQTEADVWLKFKVATHLYHMKLTVHKVIVFTWLQTNFSPFVPKISIYIQMLAQEAVSDILILNLIYS